MALPKTKSRRIIVDEMVYRYAISVSKRGDASFDLNITVQNEKDNAGKLFLKGLVTRDFWLDFSDLVGEGIDRSNYPTITPMHVQYFIRRALDEGWDRAKPGNFVLAVSNEDLERSNQTMQKAKSQR
ncbi:hypothetical protein BTA51_26820 [Hahella sp. CCB-MM4]|uniref:hypothetical protein n=1 Tax=Hahella sp. (strain CCB-MM4) TaxID=1926491 RepID=UPI000B9BE44F|nr:hypothetical protein [Hahella sp. CCB-MM4]OZG70331.1 hypothetical protein BTA51_26820 [Hahella sp. CCB-MM4]